MVNNESRQEETKEMIEMNIKDFLTAARQYLLESAAAFELPPLAATVKGQ